MSFVNNIRNYILEDEFKLIFRGNTINIVNYDSIIDVGDKSIKIRYYDGILEVVGRGLKINKLLNDEILITGDIHSIKIRWSNE